MSQQPTESNQPKQPEEAKESMFFQQKMDIFKMDYNEEWSKNFLDYSHLKKLLKEGVISNAWTSKDEQTFVTALDENLEKVFNFVEQKFQEINEQLDILQNETTNPDASFNPEEFAKKLDRLLSEAEELEKFQRLNFTGFLKITKKHDRIHPEYSVKPLLNVRLKSLPFHSEDFSPLLYKVGALYQFFRDNYQVDASFNSLSKMSSLQETNNEFQSFKFWIHPDNLVEVKANILRHLPVLIYNSKNNGDDDDDDDDDDDEEGGHKHITGDQTINAIYFDNDHLDLYNNKLTKLNNSSTLRIRWVGKLDDKPKITMERKLFDSNSNFFVDEIIELRKKYINQFVIQHEIPKKLIKLNDEKSVEKLLDFIKENHLQPVLRTTYNRTAFQIPGDDRIRITIDSNLTFIREDAFDSQLPIRDPKQWHRLDLDNSKTPQNFLRKGEFVKFPFSSMEIKIKKSSAKNFKKLQWVNELINSSYLVKEIPNFSKFIHGVAALFLEDEKLDNIPMWFNELEGDIVNDLPKLPQKVNSEGITELSNDENLSKFKSMILNNKKSNFQPRSASFSGSLLYSKGDNPAMDDAKRFETIEEAIDSNKSAPTQQDDQAPPSGVTDDQSSDFDEDEEDEDEGPSRKSNPLVRLINFPNQFSKLADVDSEDEEIELPAGVTKPDQWIKNMGPIKIEPKVWLANERTFNRWLHVTTLFSSLTFIIYSSTKDSNFEMLSTNLAYFYFALTLFSGVWAYYIFMERRKIILERSDKHLDNSIGPLIVAFGLLVALIINFVFGWKNLDLKANEEFYKNNPMHKTVHEFVINLVN